MTGFIPISEGNFLCLEKELSQYFDDFYFDEIGLNINSYGKHRDLDSILKKISNLMPKDSHANLAESYGDPDDSMTIYFLRGPNDKDSEGSVWKDFIREIYPINPYENPEKEKERLKLDIKTLFLSIVETSKIKLTWEEIFNE
jgi:hypothetical protein